MFIVTVGSGVLVALFLPANPTPLKQAIYGGVGALITLLVVIIVVYLIHVLTVTPYRQRNEALAELAKIAQSMAYSLQVEVVGNYPPNTAGLGIKIRLKNTSGKPLRYQVKTLGVKLDNINPDAPNLFNNGGIIYDEGDFTLPMLLPKVDRNRLHHGIVDLTIDYGRPDDRARRRIDVSAILTIGKIKTDVYWRRPQKEDPINIAFTDEKPTWQPVVDIREDEEGEKWANEK